MPVDPKSGESEEEEDEHSKTSHMNRSDLELLLAAVNAARADAAAAASLIETQKMPAELGAMLQQTLKGSEAQPAPAHPKSAAARRSEFAALMAELSEHGRSFVQVAMAKAQVNASGAPDDFVADFLRNEVVHHAALGSLEALLAEMIEPHYALKIATAYAVPRIS